MPGGHLESVVSNDSGGTLGHGPELLTGGDRVHALYTRHHRQQARA
jgi:hypothetical protein